MVLPSKCSSDGYERYTTVMKSIVKKVIPISVRLKIRAFQFRIFGFEKDYESLDNATIFVNGAMCGNKFLWQVEAGFKWSARCPTLAARAIEIQKIDSTIALCEVEMLGVPAYRCKCKNGSPVPGFYCHSKNEQMCVSCDSWFRQYTKTKCEPMKARMYLALLMPWFFTMIGIGG